VCSLFVVKSVFPRNARLPRFVVISVFAVCSGPPAISFRLGPAPLLLCLVPSWWCRDWPAMWSSAGEWRLRWVSRGVGAGRGVEFGRLWLSQVLAELWACKEAEPSLGRRRWLARRRLRQRRGVRAARPTRAVPLVSAISIRGSARGEGASRVGCVVRPESRPGPQMDWAHQMSPVRQPSK